MGREVSLDTVESVVFEIYKLAKTIDPNVFLSAQDWINRARREIGGIFADYDLLVSPSAAIVAPEHGLYGLSLTDIDPVDYISYGDRPVQYSFPFNVAGAPAISLPLAMHSSELPIGVQLAGRPSEDHVVIAVSAQLEEAMPWADRIAPLHVANAV